MATRVQVILDEQEKELFQRQARREGLSLSAWLRRAGEQRLRSDARAPKIDSVTELRAFFSACDEREEGREPDWEEHRAVLEASIRSGEAEE
jgi:hypothetical protein